MRFIIILILLLKFNSCFSQKNITFLRFQVFDDSTVYDCSKPIELDFKPQHIGISFVDNSDPVNAKYAIKLKGSDNVEWIKVGKQNFMSYSNLYGGEYEFLVKNLRNNTQNSLKFKIKPAFWQSWWFVPSIFLYIISVLGIIIYLFVMYRFRQKLRTQRMQDKIARDLHDDVGSTLSSIAILTQVAQNQLIDAPDKTKKLLTEISQNAQEMLENMSDIVWTNKVLNDNFEQLMVRMQEFLAKMLEPKEIEYKFYFDDSLKNIKWNAQKYYDFYMIFKEAINNSVKYADANLLKVNILREKNSIVLKIEDNGRGFEQNKIMSGNGMANMKKRAEQMKGIFKINSEIKKGTLIEVNIPL
jgi:nitrate/nitrite-specific signal transduction histidine kinase